MKIQTVVRTNFYEKGSQPAQASQFLLKIYNIFAPINQLHHMPLNFKTVCTFSRTSHGILPWNKVQVLQVSSKPHEIDESDQEKIQEELAGTLKCRYCEQVFLPAEMENHLRFSHGVMSVRQGVSTELSITEAAEALLKTLTPQPDYLLRTLTPLPMESLDELIMDSALSKAATTEETML